MGLEQLVEDLMWEPPREEGRVHVWTLLPESLEALAEYFVSGAAELRAAAAENSLTLDMSTLRAEVVRDGRIVVVSAMVVEAEAE